MNTPHTSSTQHAVNSSLWTFSQAFNVVSQLFKLDQMTGRSELRSGHVSRTSGAYTFTACRNVWELRRNDVRLFCGPCRITARGVSLGR
jgi:hypothetical protein